MFHGLILAGGRSTRMGQDKSGLIYQSNTLLSYAKLLLKNSACEQIVLSSNQHPDAIKDRYHNIGPVAGIEAGLNYLYNNFGDCTVVIIPVDMVLMKPRTIEKLIFNLSSYDLIHYQDNPLPMVLRLTRKSQNVIESMVRNANPDTGLSIKAMCRALKSITIAPENMRELFNCNSPEDFRLLSEQSE